MTIRVAVLDDWQDVAETAADWRPLRERAEVAFFRQPFANEDAAAAALVGYDVILAMRERTRFPASLVNRLPRLRLFNLTGMRAALVDMEALSAQGVTVCGTGGGETGAATAELAFALILALARNIPAGDAAVRAGRFQLGVAAGFELSGKTLGILGLGRIGARVASYGRAFGMQVLAWSHNLTEEKAAAAGARFCPKDDLLRSADVVSLHLVLSDRTRAVLGRRELALLRDGAAVVNTSRSGLIDGAALVAELATGRIRAALDVYDREPLSSENAIVSLPGTVLTPHLGYSTIETYRIFYREAVENVLAFLDRKPIRVLKAPSVSAER